ncbi:Signal recognition particle receptor subunit beta [Tetrabaena socialis]|uniref:Signal recognition particle receptor subunit beta n=1 Tax=Tetrabaena socialis TaxID=47790 RepID=A0A2J7ZT74_9CHLO|nr:Signal recognition particle receptor subunit beta [Tetrabaena socialis]|eukprot:PNH03471.1 Signal recognition particle receptor subunit beta [Tetrabaena socialis]
MADLPLLAPGVQIALLVVAATILILLFRLLSGGKRGSVVLLVGPCNAGKTTLFYQLKDGTSHLGTVASMQENEGWCQLRNDKDKPVGSVKVLDLPGHPRLRSKLDQYLRDASAVVLVLDSADITPHKTEAAEDLFEVLTHPTVLRRRVPVLLACNKADLETQAHSVEFCRRTLEKQLDAMRKTRLALGSEQGKAIAALGKTDKPLSLAALRSPISAASISAEKGDVAEVTRFLVKLL